MLPFLVFLASSYFYVPDESEKQQFIQYVLNANGMYPQQKEWLINRIDNENDADCVLEKSTADIIYTLNQYFKVLEGDVNKTCSVISHLKDPTKQEYFEKTAGEHMLKILVSIRKISRLIRKLEARNNEIEFRKYFTSAMKSLIEQPKVDSKSKHQKKDDDKI